MPTPTYTAIATTTVGAGGSANITFSSIPSTYTDLLVKISARNTSNSYVFDYLNIAFNTSTANYTSRTLEGDGSSTYSYTQTTYGTNFIGRINGALATTSTFGNAEIYFPNYAGSTNKSMSSDYVTENNATTAWDGLAAGLWSQTAAINEIQFTLSVGNFAQYSTATLYGISKT